MPWSEAHADWSQSTNSNVLAVLSAQRAVDLPIDALEARTPRLQGRLTSMSEALNSTMPPLLLVSFLSGVGDTLRNPN